jgi:cellulose biosynthesis protein BcsQ
LIIGPGLLRGPKDEIAHITKAVPHTPLIAVSDENALPLSSIEYLARLGVEEVLPRAVSAADFLRRLVMLSSRVSKRQKGSLIVVEGAKGGVGATTVAAGLAESYIEAGFRTLLIDLDCYTQALSRFLHVRPFVNETLQAILEGARPLAQDFIEQCCVPVWSDISELRCMTPTHRSVLEGVISPQRARILVNLLEALDGLFDCIVIDAGSIRGALGTIIRRAADSLILVTENDPASVFAASMVVQTAREELAADAKLLMLENRRCRVTSGIDSRLLRSEFKRLSGVEPEQWISGYLPFHKGVARWPGSGSTPFSIGGRSIQSVLNGIRCVALGGLSQPDQDSRFTLRRLIESLVVGYGSGLESVRGWVRRSAPESQRPATQELKHEAVKPERIEQAVPPRLTWTQAGSSSRGEDALDALIGEPH